MTRGTEQALIGAGLLALFGVIVYMGEWAATLKLWKELLAMTLEDMVYGLRN